MRRRGLEPPRGCPHQHLKLARLPSSATAAHDVQVSPFFGRLRKCCRAGDLSCCLLRLKFSWAAVPNALGLRCAEHAETKSRRKLNQRGPLQRGGTIPQDPWLARVLGVGFSLFRRLRIGHLNFFESVRRRNFAHFFEGTSRRRIAVCACFFSRWD